MTRASFTTALYSEEVMARRTYWAAALGLVAANVMLANALLAQSAPPDNTRVERHATCTWMCGHAGSYQGCPVVHSDIDCGGSACSGKPGGCNAH